MPVVGGAINVIKRNLANDPRSATVKVSLMQTACQSRAAARLTNLNIFYFRGDFPPPGSTRSGAAARPQVLLR
jgi:hypothetical protein